MTRTGQAAIDAGNASIGPNVMPASGRCLQFVRDNVFGVPSLYATAIDAWDYNPTQHPDDRNPPPAVPVWFWSASSARHVAFYAGDGRIITTYNADVRAYGMADMERIYGPYMGWAEQINDVTIYTVGQDEGDDMQADERSWLQDVFNRVRSLGGDDPNQPLTTGDNFEVLASRTNQVPEIYDRIRGDSPEGDMLQLIRQDIAQLKTPVGSSAPITRGHVLAALLLLVIITLAIVVAVVAALANGDDPVAVVAGASHLGSALVT